MSATPPDAPEFRGKTLTPVSPKPLHFPSPANIPILGQQMDPSFSETMMQTMHPATFPSMAQHTIPATNPPMPQSVDQGAHSIANAQAADGMNGGEGAENGLLQSVEQSGSDSQSNPANQIYAQGTQSLSNASSEAATATSGAETYPGIDRAPVDPSSATAAQLSVYPNYSDVGQSGASNPADDTGSAAVNYEALLASISNPISNISHTDIAAPPTPTQNTSNSKSPSSALPSNPNLPPKPPAQAKPITHPNYAPGDDIRSYHPHSQKDASASYRSQNSLPNITTNGLPQPPHVYQTPMSATKPLQSPALSTYGQRDTTPMSADEDAPFDSNTQRLFDQFLQYERQNVADGQWDKFPVGSRLFIGNLPTEKVTKKDVFRRFFKYGQLAQISLKQAYGFVQFLDADTCHRALQAEQGQKMRGRDMHLEISKPQKNTRDAGRGNRNERRRSRSPDYNRGGAQGQGPRGVDRYTSGSQVSPRDRDYRRGRDDYRPGRSPSPRGRRGGADRYDGRRRSRSRSPYNRNGRYRSPRLEPEDDLPLPRRAPQDVPDIQIIVVDDLDRQFIEWVDKTMQARGVRVNVLLLNPRLAEEAVVRRQILEGVQAVVRLGRMHQMKGKIPLQMFNRSGGHNNVQFEQYEDLDPPIAAELVIRAKQTHQAPQASYGLPPAPAPSGYGIPPPTYGYPPAQPPSQQPPPSANPDISNIISSLGGAGAAASNPDIARLLSQTHQPQAPNPGVAPDLARILGQLNQPQQQAQGYGQPPVQAPPGSQQNNPYAQSSNATQAQQQQPPQQDIQRLLADLTAYKPPA